MFDRLELLIGKENLNKIKTKNILVIGCGGVGGNCITALIRSGIENITLIDFDKIDISNINRQEVAYLSNVGKSKVESMKNILLDINSNVKVNAIDMYLDESNIKEIFDNNSFDYVIDACDSIKTKEAIILECINRNINFITCTGTGYRMHPEMLKITELKKTSGDPIARLLRKWVKDSRIKGKIMVCTSDELPIGRGKPIASCSFVPPSAGLLIASHVINNIIK